MVSLLTPSLLVGSLRDSHTYPSVPGHVSKSPQGSTYLPVWPRVPPGIHTLTRLTLNFSKDPQTHPSDLEIFQGPTHPPVWPWVPPGIHTPTRLTLGSSRDPHIYLSDPEFLQGPINLPVWPWVPPGPQTADVGSAGCRKPWMSMSSSPDPNPRSPHSSSLKAKSGQYRTWFLRLVNSIITRLAISIIYSQWLVRNSFKTMSMNSSRMLTYRLSSGWGGVDPRWGGCICRWVHPRGFIWMYPPPLWTAWHTPVKTLPSPILHMRSVIESNIIYILLRKLSYFSSTSRIIRTD